MSDSMTQKDKAAAYDRLREINKLSYQKRQARIKLERERYAEAVAAGKITAVTDAEVEAEMKK